jgi:hypothetical protein
LKKIIFFALFLPIIFFSIPDFADSSEQEVQVPLDEEGKILTIDVNLERKLGLFPEYETFQEAKLFKSSDTTFVLEVYYRKDGNNVKDRIYLLHLEVSNMRKKVTEEIEKKAPTAFLDQSGRIEFLGGILALSVGFYGWAVPYSLNVEDPKLSTALVMFTSGGSFFLPFGITRNMKISKATSSLSFYGGSRGIVHGICFNVLIFGSDATGRGIVATGMVTSISEAFAGFYLANRTRMNEGTASVIGVGGDFGMAWGLGVAHLADFFEYEERRRGVGASVLGGSGIGLLFGKWLDTRQEYTRGDATVLQATGILGAYIPLSVVSYLDPDNEKMYTYSSMIGSAIGLGFGNHLIRGKNFSSGQGALLILGEVAGGLIGVGFANLIQSEGDSERTLFLASSSIGASLGFFLMYRSVADDARVNESSLLWKIDLHPEGLWRIVDGGEKEKNHLFPLVSIGCRF